MKHGGLVFAGIALMLLFAFVPLTAQQGSINYQTYMVDTFDNPDGQGWSISLSEVNLLLKAILRFNILTECLMQ